MRFSHALLSLGLSHILLAGCSSEVIVVPNGAAERPPGCSATICDVEYERCEARPAEDDACTNCKLDCQLEDTASGYAACSNSCMYTCSAVGRPRSCSEKLSTCRKTNANRGCVDGMDRQLVPNIVSPWQYDSVWDCSIAACTGEASYRSVCVELAEASVCMR